MRKAAIHLLLFFFVSTECRLSLFGQSIPVNKPDSSKYNAIQSAAFYTSNKSVATWVIDNQIMDEEMAETHLTKIDASTILEINVLKDSSPLTSSASGSGGPAILITTKAYAREQVELLLSRLAKGYKEYRQAHKDDEDFTYVVDGKLLEGNRDEILRKLYDTPLGEINHASILDKYKLAIAMYHTIIAITTKGEK